MNDKKVMAMEVKVGDMAFHVREGALFFLKVAKVAVHPRGRAITFANGKVVTCHPTATFLVKTEAANAS
jgi:hypothetical protein